MMQLQPPFFTTLRLHRHVRQSYRRANSRQSRVRSGRSASLKRSALCADSPALLGLAARRITRFVRFALSARTDAASQLTKRAVRAAASPVLLGASEAHCSLSARGFAEAVLACSRWHASTPASRQVVSGGGDLCGGEEHRAGVGARSALRPHACRSCLSAGSEANAASSSARPRNEHRSAVEAKRRPSQCEPSPGTACREAGEIDGQGVAFREASALR